MVDTVMVDMQLLRRAYTSIVPVITCHCTAAERLCDDLASLIPTLVKPLVDIGWFSWQLWRLTGRRGMAILYLYTLLGWGSLR